MEPTWASIRTSTSRGGQSARYVLVVGLYELPAAVDDAVRGLALAPGQFGASLLHRVGERLGKHPFVLIDVDRFTQVDLVPIRLFESPVMRTAFDQGNRRRLGFTEDVLASVRLRAAEPGQHLADGNVAVAGLFRLENRVE